MISGTIGVALDPASIGRALFHQHTVRLMRREVRRKEGLAVDEEDLAKALHDMLSVEARELIGPMKIRRQRSPQQPGKDAQVVRAGRGRQAP